MGRNRRKAGLDFTLLTFPSGFDFMKTQLRNTLLMGALAVAGLSIAQAGPISLDLSAAQGDNLLVWGNASLSNSDIQGRVAAGGNVTMSSYSIGGSLAGGSTPALIAGGTLSGSWSHVYNGNIDVGGSASGTIYTDSGYTTNAGMGSSVPFAFTSAENTLLTDSLLWGVQAATGTSVLQWSTLTLTGASSGVNVFDITAAQLQGASTVTINAPTGSQVLINVSGTSVSLSNMGFNGTFASDTDTLFNFYQATTVTMSGIGLNGSVLAPEAAVNFNNGQLNGELIAASFSGGGELHNYVFDSHVPTTTSCVPDGVATAPLLLISLAGFVACAGLHRSNLAKRGA